VHRVKDVVGERYGVADDFAIASCKSTHSVEATRRAAAVGTHFDDRAGKISATATPPSPAPDAATFAKGLGDDVARGEQRPINRHLRKPYEKRARMPSMLDPHVTEIESWLAAEPWLTALAISGRLSERCPDHHRRRLFCRHPVPPVAAQSAVPIPRYPHRPEAVLGNIVC